jgi:hypothetical protein
MTSSDAFTNVPSTCKVVIPDCLYDRWVNATNWSSLDVIYVKESEYSIEQGETFSFSIDGITYQASEGMDWYAWANSDFDTENIFYCSGRGNSPTSNSKGIYYNGKYQSGRDIIVENGEYQTK